MGNTVAFGGFTDGSAVSINEVTVNTWGVVASGGLVWDLTPTPGTGVTVNTFRTEHQVAPDGAFFSLTLTGFDTNTVAGRNYDPSYYDKEVFFDYGEGYTFTAPTQVLALDAADGGQRCNSRYTRGPIGSHVYRTPGTHTVRVAVVEPSSGKIGITSVQISVADPAVYYSGPATLFVDTTGNNTNVPSGAQTFTSIGAALTALGNTTTPHRVVLERGQTHTMTSGFNFNSSASSANTSFRLEARQGTGARPIVANTLGNNATLLIDNSRNGTSGPTGFVVQGIDFLGTYDPVANTGPTVKFLLTHVTQAAASVITDDITVTGFHYVIDNITTQGAEDPDRLMFFNDHAIDGWGGIAMFGGQGSKVAFHGCRHAQNPRAGNSINDGATLGPARIGRCEFLHMQAIDFFQSNGWSGLGNQVACQPALRLYGQPTSAWTKLNIQSSVFESGRYAMYFKPFAPSETRIPQLAIFEGNMFITGHQASEGVQIGHGGTCWRNNVITRSGALTVAPSAFFRGTGGDSASPVVNQTTPMLVYNNSLLNNTSDSMGVTQFDVVQFTNTSVDNNLIHQPNLGTPDVPSAPVTLVQAVTPRYEGYDNNGTFQTQFATPEEGGRIPVPQAGSTAIDASDTTGLTAGTQFRAQYQRSAVIAADLRDLGAVER